MTLLQSNFQNPIIRVFATVLVILVLGVPAQSGTLRQMSGPICDWMLSGQVTKGDADRVDSIPGSVGGQTICLNSPGGNLLEGQKLFHVLWDKNLNTAVLPGHQCASACAVAFLGGSTTQGTDLVRFMNRSIFPGARLGYHGPSLNLSGGTQNYPSAAVNQSFDIALKAAEQFFLINRTEDRGNRGLTDHLFHRILSTRADDMYWIETVGDAILADVDLRGVRYPTRLTRDHVRNVCDNLNLRGGFPSAQGTTETVDPNFVSTAQTLAKFTSDRFEDFFSVSDGNSGAAGPYFSGTKYYWIECYLIEASSALGDVNEEFLSSHSINVSLRSSQSERDPNRVDLRAWIRDSEELQEYYVPPWYMLRFDTPLDQLPTGRTLGMARQESGAKGQAANPAGKQLIAFKGFDLEGGDLRHLTFQKASDCVAACNGTTGCSAVTYDRWNSICFMKSVRNSNRKIVRSAKATTYIAKAEVGGVKRSYGSISIKRRKGKGFFDKDPIKTFIANSYETCRAACMSDNICLAFNYQPARRTCEHFETPGEYFDRKGYEIGLKTQSN